MPPKKLKPKDIAVLSKMVEYANAGELQPAKKAIMEVYGYTKDDKYLAQKVRNQKVKLLHDRSVAEIVELYGITITKIGQKVGELLEATKPVYYLGDKLEDMADNRARVEAVKIAMDLLGVGHKAGSKQDIAKQVNNLIVFVESEEDARERIEQDSSEHEVIKKSYSVEEEASE